MADSYDDKIESMLLARRRIAEQKKAQRQKELQKQLAVAGGAFVALILVIVLIFKGCSADKSTNDKKDKVPAVETTVEAATEEAEEMTTVAEETTTAANADSIAGGNMYTTDILNFRTEPSTEAEMIRHIPKGAKVKVIAEEGEWCNITYKNHTGYVMTQYLSKTKPE